MEDLKTKLDAIKERFDRAWPLVKIQDKQSRLANLRAEMSEPNFWSNIDRARKIGQEASNLEKNINDWEKMRADLEAFSEIIELDQADQSVNLTEEAAKELPALIKRFEELELAMFFSGKYDEDDAILAIHAGAGGTDAQDWAEMLLRMYLRFAEKRGWQTSILHLSPGSEAGLKSVVVEIKGHLAYGHLRAEAGVHRLVRISPFDAEKMRHTSFALVEVLPFFESSEIVNIKPEDLRIDTFRAGGKGGQSVNTTDSAVRITHLPTGIVVSCQNERSQVQNKEKAMKVLAAKLEQYYATELEDEKKKLRGEYTEAAWGNQARSYVIHPYKMVKDHRTHYEASNVEEVLDGELLPVIESYLRFKK